MISVEKASLLPRRLSLLFTLVRHLFCVSAANPPRDRVFISEMKKLLLFAVLLCALDLRASAAPPLSPPVVVAVLDFGDAEAGRRIADELHAALRAKRDGGPSVALVSRAAARSAARGVGYKGSLNLSLAEARDLAAAVGCDSLFIGSADTLRRQSSARPVYYESYASIFLVSAYTGRLLLWERLSAEAGGPDEAEKSLLAQLRARAQDYVTILTKARYSESAERASANEHDAPVIEDAPAQDTPAARNFREPLPYRRLRPSYTEQATRSEIEATIDALVELDAEGEVRSVEIVRWAGYGLDESVASTIRQMHFRPALQEGKPVPVRVLLRYNFRRPRQD